MYVHEKRIRRKAAEAAHLDAFKTICSTPVFEAGDLLSSPNAGSGQTIYSHKPKPVVSPAGKDTEFIRYNT